jgi:4'-phosphopantetheinyl transferase
MTAEDWMAPPPSLALGGSEVHVWVATLDVDDGEIAARAAVLDDEERARAGRMAREVVWRRFVAGRGFLRMLLGRYLDISPARVALTQGQRGKPGLAEPGGGSGLRFNLAHSDGLAVCALARGREIGADVERVRADVAVEELARRFFAPAEAADLVARPVAERRLAFFRAWTRKEAYIKGRGDGLSWPLDGFEVSIGPDAALVVDRNAPEAPGRWWLTEVRPEPGYVGALAVEGPACPVRRWRWP